MMGFPGTSAGKESTFNAGDPGSIPESGKSPGGGIGYPLHYSWASLVVAQLVKNQPAMQETGFDPWIGKIPWRREQLPTPVFWPEEIHGLYSPWNSPGWNTGIGSLSLFQGIFPAQRLNPGLPHCRQILYQQLIHKGSSRIFEWVAYPFSSGSS